MQVAILGLGKMGYAIFEKLLGNGHELVAWNRSPQILDLLRTEKATYIVNKKLTIAHSLAELKTVLRKPRVIWSMLPAGEATESVLAQLNDFVEQGDVIIDGGNSSYKDTEKRAEDYAQKGVKFLGVGVSGGVHGFANGFCMMVGGDKGAYEYCNSIFESLSKPAATHTYFGPGGAGHFVKMVHNGIEYGMMQSLAEGYGVLAKSPYKFDLQAVTKTYQAGSIVMSFLLNMIADALQKDPTLSKTQGVIGATGEGEWTIEAGKELAAPVEVIEKSLEFRQKSEYDKGVQDSFTAKIVQAMRHEFGGHGEPQQAASQTQPQQK